MANAIIIAVLIIVYILKAKYHEADAEEDRTVLKK